MKKSIYRIRLIDYLIHAIYFLIYGVFKYWPSPIGDFFRFLIISIFIRKLRSWKIYEGVTIWYPYRVSIGKNVSINEWCYLSGFGGLVIEDGVRIGHRTSIVTSEHIFESREKSIREQGINAHGVHICEDVWIGANVTILGGVKIGRGAVIAAGSVVNKNIDEYSVVGGVPAIKLKMRN